MYAYSLQVFALPPPRSFFSEEFESCSPNSAKFHSVVLHSTGSVTICSANFARFSPAQAEPVAADSETIKYKVQVNRTKSLTEQINISTSLLNSPVAISIFTVRLEDWLKVFIKVWESAVSVASSLLEVGPVPPPVDPERLLRDDEAAAVAAAAAPRDLRGRVVRVGGALREKWIFLSMIFVQFLASMAKYRGGGIHCIKGSVLILF